MPPYGGRGVVGAALYKRVSRPSLRGRQAVAIRVPRPFFKSILKWQFENPTIHQSGDGSLIDALALLSPCFSVSQILLFVNTENRPLCSEILIDSIPSLRRAARPLAALFEFGGRGGLRSGRPTERPNRYFLFSYLFSGVVVAAHLRGHKTPK